MKYYSTELDGHIFNEEELDNLTNTNLFIDSVDNIQFFNNCLCINNEMSEIIYSINKINNSYQLKLDRIDNYYDSELIDSIEF